MGFTVGPPPIGRRTLNRRKESGLTSASLHIIGRSASQAREVPVGNLDEAISALSAAGMLTTEVEQLFGFSDALQQELDAFRDAMFTQVLQPMGDNLVNFGGGGLLEGFAFQQPYTTCQQALGMFFFNAVSGLATLQAAAAIVGARYLRGDADSADLLAAVDAAFAEPTDTERSRGAQLAAAAGELSEEERRRLEMSVRQQFWDEVGQEHEQLGQDGFRREVLSGDTEPLLPSSDYYEPETVLRADGTTIIYRDLAGQGAGAIRIDPDHQNVNALPIPDVAEGETVIDGVDLRQPATGEMYDEITDIEYQRSQGDWPGTRDDQ